DAVLLGAELGEGQAVEHAVVEGVGESRVAGGGGKRHQRSGTGGPGAAGHLPEGRGVVLVERAGQSIGGVLDLIGFRRRAVPAYIDENLVVVEAVGMGGALIVLPVGAVGVEEVVVVVLRQVGHVQVGGPRRQVHGEIAVGD